MGAQVDRQALLESAWRARENAYAPYSHFPVGAALITESGEIFLGCNVENVSFGLTICAERSAVAAAIGTGSCDLVAIAIVSMTTRPVVPCGACRQVLAEFNPNLLVLSEGKGGAQAEWSLSFLLPKPTDGIFKR